MSTIGQWIIKAEARGTGLAVEYKDKRTWHKITWQEYIHKVISAYDFLKTLGLKPKNHAGLMSATRWEWSALDLALLGSGSVVVPMYPNLSDDDLAYIINHSDITVLIIENETHSKQIERIKSQFTRDIKVISLAEISFNREISNELREEFFNLCRKVDLKSIATIVYTSGTTGKPKGAVLLHEAIVSEVTESFELFGVKPTYKSLTFLPFAHVLGRIEHWGSCWNGHAISYAESIERIKSNLKEVKPDFLIAVPRIFEKVYSGIMAQVETQKYKQKIFTQALDAAHQMRKYRKTRESVPWLLLAKYEALNKIAFGPIQDAFGGNLKFAVSGGAPISYELVDFFACCGLPILEGYGLTETCAAVSVNTLSQHEAGTVGKPIGEVQIKFGADGEILVKSKKCLVEYYKNPEETEKNIIDGYFATGDIGQFNELGFLKITDRKKDLIKTAGGKYVAPQKLEGLLKQDPLISQVLIHGDQKKFICALLTFDEIQIKQWADQQQLKYESVADIYNSPVLKVRLQRHIQTINSKLASFEAIKKFEIIHDAWTVENGSLTQSLKVKRKHLEAKYADLIEGIYE
ncbi:long-chain fatty acid--CoA ligase [bacterium]|nr:long-chain fatty acid--CoA ligase [bacterium]